MIQILFKYWHQTTDTKKSCKFKVKYFSDFINYIFRSILVLILEVHFRDEVEYTV